MASLIRSVVMLGTAKLTIGDHHWPSLVIWSESATADCSVGQALKLTVQFLKYTYPGFQSVIFFRKRMEEQLGGPQRSGVHVLLAAIPLGSHTRKT